MRIARQPLCYLLLALLGHGGRVVAQAASPPTTPPATATPAVTVQQCYKAVTPDSVVFFYDPYYKLVPPGCAAIRRHSRIDSVGYFRGIVRDYRLSNNVLLLTGAYRNRQKNGRFELFYPNGVLAARGNYYNDQLVGDWAYWYPSGQPRQIVRFEQQQLPTLQRFWDSAGTLTVVNGAGQWQQDDGITRLTGTISGGLPEGKWERRFIKGRQVYSVEHFTKGVFRNGHIFYEPGPQEAVIPLDVDVLPFLDIEDFDQAERFVLGAPCPPPQGAK